MFTYYQHSFVLPYFYCRFQLGFRLKSILLLYLVLVLIVQESMNVSAVSQVLFAHSDLSLVLLSDTNKMHEIEFIYIENNIHKLGLVSSCGCFIYFSLLQITFK